MSNLYIVAGCNGAGKTTASYTVLPEILDCKEFVNADSIAAGISPFNPSSVALEAGRIMLHRIDQLLIEKADFGFETTLSAKSYLGLIRRAREEGYEITLLYFWLNSPDMAKQRVAKRVKMGGHDIPSDTIERRYYRGIQNLFSIYMGVCDTWMVYDNMGTVPDIVATGAKNGEKTVKNSYIWNIINKQSSNG